MTLMTDLSEENLNTLPCPHKADPNMKPQTLLIDGCGCAVMRVSPEGEVVYDWDLLVIHFAEHEFGDAAEDEEERVQMAVEWLDYNVLRGLEYVGDGVIIPKVFDGDQQICPWLDEDEDEEA